jgi:molecular chaperone DnaK (HSP70)
MDTTGFSGQGTRRIGVDFGVSLTVVAAGDPLSGISTLACPGISRRYAVSPDGSPVHCIPSLIHYDGGKIASVGTEVEDTGRTGDLSTARCMRQYLCERSPVQVPAGQGRMVRYEEAATDYLTALLARALGPHAGTFGLVFSLPENAPEGYKDWLTRVARAAGVESCSWVHEFLAAAHGYGYTPVAGEPFLVIAFSETGLEVTAVIPDGTGCGGENGGLRVLGHAADPLSCSAIDGWIARDLLKARRLTGTDTRAGRLLPDLIRSAGRARETAAGLLEETFGATDPVSGLAVSSRFGPAELDRILAENRVVPLISQVIDRALSAMRTRGGDADRIGAVLMIGAGSALPPVREAARKRFAAVPVFADHPLDAIARGAAQYTAPERAPDRIMNAYALRYWDAASQEHHYRFLVHSGARFPSAGQVARIVISAAYDGQTHLGIPVYEIGGDANDPAPGIELVTDRGGGMRLTCPAQDATGRQAVHVNERTPTLLVATPPARKGETRFECTFTIDPERNLCLSARDLLTGSLVKVNVPVHQLK